MLLLRALFQPKLRPLSRRPRKRPLLAHNHDLVDCELDLEPDGGEDALVGGRQGLGADGGGEAWGEEDAVCGVEGEEGGEGGRGEDVSVGGEEGGYFVVVGGG